MLRKWVEKDMWDAVSEGGGKETSSGAIAIIQVRDGCTVVVVEVLISNLFIQIEIRN